MFYSVELNRGGKSPLARMWQACHGMRMPRKIVEEFDVAGKIQKSPSPLPCFEGSQPWQGAVGCALPERQGD